MNREIMASVVMPVFNAVESVDAAIDGVVAESTEIIVVDDGSTDGTLERLRAREDIRLISREHQGVVAASNAGIAAARGTYIARMDADDVSHPERIPRQMEYLDQHPNIGIVGCRVAFGGNRDQHAGYAEHVDWLNTIQTPDEIALNRFVEAPLAHPSMMFRRELFERHGAYRDGPFPEDYELFLRFMSEGVRVGKVDTELLTWNDPPSRLSRTDPRYSFDAFYETKARYLSAWLAKNNPRHPRVWIWGAGRVTRKRAEFLRERGLEIEGYIDLKARVLSDQTPVIHHDDLPSPDECFVLSMVANRGAREKIRAFLRQRGYVEGRHCLFMA